MANDATRGSMVSRSVRLHKDTLTELEKRATDEGVGVTVLMRQILENYLVEPATVVPYGAAPEQVGMFTYA